MNQSSLIVCLFTLAATAQSARAGDELCGPLKDFVSSVSSGETRELRFHTIWGGNFKDRTDKVSGAKRCEFDGYEPAKPVCAWLMKYAYINAAGANAKSVISCLSKKTSFDLYTRVNTISVSVPIGNVDKGKRVDVDLAENDEIGGMLLKITVSARGLGAHISRE